MTRDTNVDRYAGMVLLLMRQPRTRRELMRLTGISHVGISTFLRALRDKGLLITTRAPKEARLGDVGPTPWLWTWVSNP